MAQLKRPVWKCNSQTTVPKRFFFNDAGDQEDKSTFTKRQFQEMETYEICLPHWCYFEILGDFDLTCWSFVLDFYGTYYELTNLA